MYSTFHGLETIKRALVSNKYSLDVIGHNISNANTEGYSRQRLDLTEMSPLANLQMNKLPLPGQIGQGVIAQDVERIRSSFLDVQYRVENQIFHHWDNVYTQLRQVEILLNEPSDTSLRSIIDEFWKAWEDLANDPQTPATRQVVVERGISLANAIKETYTELTSLQENLNLELEQRVGEINRIADNIADLNLKIKQIKGSGDNPNDLLDKRDLLLDKLSELINIDMTRINDEQMIVTVNGQTLIQEGKVNHLILRLNPENNNFYDIHWERNDRKLSSNERVATVFATSSMENKTTHLEVRQLAKKHRVVSRRNLASINHPIAEDNPDITSGSFIINGMTIYIDVNRDSLSDVIRKINDASIGIEARYSDINLPNLVLTSGQEGVDNRIILQSGTSNFLREMGLIVGAEGTNEIVDKDLALPFISGGETITIDGKTITFGAGYSLQDVADEINNTEDIGVRAMILKKPSGNYVLILEGKDGNYNFNLQDNDGVLNNLGFDILTTSEERFGSAVGIKRIEDKNKRGLLNDGGASSFRITDSNGTSFDVNIDNTNDSLEEIRDEINTQALNNNANIEAAIIETPEGEYKLTIYATDGGKWSIEDTDSDPSDGTILNNLGIIEATYNDLGPYSVDAQNSVFTYDGFEYIRQSNRITDVEKGLIFTIHSEGGTDIQIRNLIQGGKIKGLLESRDEVVPYYLARLDELAYSITKNINQQHFKGFGLNGEGQYAFFKPYFSNVSGDPTWHAALSIDISQSIRDDINLIAASSASENEFSPNGLPIFSGPGDGSNALKIALVKQSKILTGNQADFSEFFTAIVSKAGVDAEISKRIRDNKELLVSKIDNQRTAVSGVSLDEEMANMVKFQQAYNAAAKMAATYNSMLDTIMNRLGI